MHILVAEYYKFCIDEYYIFVRKFYVVCNTVRHAATEK